MWFRYRLYSSSYCLVSRCANRRWLIKRAPTPTLEKKIYVIPPNGRLLRRQHFSTVVEHRADVGLFWTCTWKLRNKNIVSFNMMILWINKMFYYDDSMWTRDDGYLRCWWTVVDLHGGSNGNIQQKLLLSTYEEVINILNKLSSEKAMELLNTKKRLFMVKKEKPTTIIEYSREL
jgi:hypothetical protein